MTVPAKDLAARVAHLEAQVQELRQSSAPAGLAYGLSLVRDEVAELRTETQAGFVAVNDRLGTLAEGIQQILARLGAN